MVEAARARTPSVTPAELAAELAGPAAPVVLDVREHEELDALGTVPGAVHVPRGVLEWAADPASPLHLASLAPARRVVLVCAVGGRSALAADVLRALGYRDVAHLGDGFRAWAAEGRPIVRSPVARPADARPPRAGEPAPSSSTPFVPPPAE